MPSFPRVARSPLTCRFLIGEDAMRKCLPVILLVLLSGCDIIHEMKNESLNKREYSILQSYGYEYINIKNEDPYLVISKALGTSYTVLAFPIKGKNTGYVVMLAQAEGDPKTKTIPSVDFVVTKSAFDAVKARTKLSPEIEQFIAAHIR